MVPIIPVKKKAAFLHKQFVKTYDRSSAAENKPEIKINKDSTPSPKAIHAAAAINGKTFRANNIPAATPAITLTSNPIKLPTLMVLSL